MRRSPGVVRTNGHTRRISPELQHVLAAEVGQRARPAPQPPGPRERAWQWLKAKHLLLTVVGCTMLALVQLGPHLTPKFGDNAEFLLLGQSLATGRGFAWVNDPAAGPHAKYPPGYPLLIAAQLLLTGTQDALPTAVPYVKLLSVALFVGSLPLLYELLARRSGAALAAVVTLLTAINPFMLKYATEVLSEVPYLFASLLGLVVLERYAAGADEKGPRPAWHALALGAVLALPYYVRTTGALLVPAGLAYLWLTRRRRDAVLVAVGAALVVLPWELRNRVLVGWTVYGGQLFGQDAAQLNYEPAALSDLLRRVGTNIVTYFTDAFDTRFAWLLPFVSVPLFALAAGGYLRALRRPTALEAYVPLYGLICLVWPFAGGRFIVPIVPFLVYYVLLFTVWLAARLPGSLWSGRRTAVALAAVAVAGAVPSLAMDAGVAAHNLRHLAADPPTYYAAQADWAAFLRAAAWLREHAERDAVVMSRKDFLMYVYGGRLSVKYRYSTEPEELDPLLAAREPRYIVEDSFDFMLGDFAPLPGALRDRGAGLRLVHETAGPRAVRVWKLVRP